MLSWLLEISNREVSLRVDARHSLADVVATRATSAIFTSCIGCFPPVMLLTMLTGKVL